MGLYRCDLAGKQKQYWLTKTLHVEILNEAVTLSEQIGSPDVVVEVFSRLTRKEGLVPLVRAAWSPVNWIARIPAREASLWNHAFVAAEANGSRDRIRKFSRGEQVCITS